MLSVMFDWFDAMYGLNIDLCVLLSQGSSADRSQWREPTRTSDGLCSLYEAALCLFEEVRNLSIILLSGLCIIILYVHNTPTC